MRIVHLLLEAVLIASLGFAGASVSVSHGEDIAAAGQTIRVTCTITGETFVEWSGPNGKIPVDSSKRVHVETPAPTERTLVISSPVDDDGGQYQCKGNINSAKYELNILSVHVPDTNQILQLGKTGAIVIRVHGYPTPDVVWKKDEQTIDVKGRFNLKDDGSLEIQNVQPSDEGSYTCIVSILNRRKEQKVEIDVKVFETAKIIKSSKARQFPTKGYNFTFLCEATGYPAPQYSWSSPGNPDIKTFDRFHVGKDTLTITNVEPGDKGEYTCKVTSGDGNTASATSEIVKVLVPPKINPALVNVVESEGAKVELKCNTVEGDPKPTVEWYKDNQPVVSQKYNGDRSESTITFDKVRITDSGEYVCKARNTAVDDQGKEIIVEKAVHVGVTSPPVHNEKASPNVVYSYVGNKKPVTVRCVFLGYPAPVVKLIAPNATVLAEGNYSAAITVMTNSPSDFSNFTCEAKNDHGSQNIDIKLEMAVAPSKPRDVQPEKTCKKITLKWEVPEKDGGMPIIEYTISIDDYSVNVLSEDDMMEHELDKDFESETSYNVEILARTEAGRSDPVKLTVKTDKYCVPGKPTITNTKTDLDENEFTLEWKAPDYDGGADEISYKVQWKDESSGKEETKTDIKETKLDIKDLDYSREYKVSLYAVNQQGPSEPAEKYFKVGKGGGGNGSNQPGVADPSTGGMSKGAIAGIVIAVILIVLIAIDLFCCFFNSCGLFFCCSVTFCGAGKAAAKSNKYNDNNAAEMEKQPLPAENV